MLRWQKTKAGRIAHREHVELPSTGAHQNPGFIQLEENDGYQADGWCAAHKGRLVVLNGPAAITWLRHRRVSVAVVLVLTIVCIVTLLLAVVGTLAYHYYSDERRQAFADRHILATDQLSFALAPSVWNLEYDQIEQLIYSRLRDPDIFGIVLELDTRKFIVGRDDNGVPRSLASPYSTTQLPAQSRTLTFEGERLGNLTLHASPRQMESEIAGKIGRAHV